MLALLKSKGFMGGVVSVLGLLSMVFGITIDQDVVASLMDNVVTVVTLVGVVVAQVVGIYGRIVAKGPLNGS